MASTGTGVSNSAVANSGYIPNTVPIDVVGSHTTARCTQFAVQTCAVGVYSKIEAVASVSESVYYKLEVVVETDVAIVFEFVADYFRWVGLKTNNSNVEIVIVIGNTNFCFFCGRLALVSIGLNEICGRYCCFPDRFVKNPIHF